VVNLLVLHTLWLSKACCLAELAAGTCTGSLVRPLQSCRLCLSKAMASDRPCVSRMEIMIKRGLLYGLY